MKSGRIILGVVSVFLLGAVCGIFGTHLLYKYRIDSIISGTGDDRERAIFTRLDRKLHLDKRQEEKVKAIIHESHEQIKALRKQLRPQTEAIVETAQKRVAALLTPEQQATYEKMIAERKEERRKRGE